MIIDTVKIALEKSGRHDIISQHTLIKFLREEDSRGLDRYLSMDDSSVLSLIHQIAESQIEDASILAKRYLRRDLYKCIEIPSSEDGPPKRRIKDFIEALKTEGVFHKLDLVSGRAYKQYEVADKKFLENILIKKGRDHERLHTASKLIRSIPHQSTRIYFRGRSQI